MIAAYVGGDEIAVERESDRGVTVPIPHRPDVDARCDGFLGGILTGLVDSGAAA
jgi:hypothetical protein